MPALFVAATMDMDHLVARADGSRGRSSATGLSPFQGSGVRRHDLASWLQEAHEHCKRKGQGNVEDETRHDVQFSCLTIKIAHEWTLFDIQARFADVVSLEDALAYLRSLPTQRGATT